MTWSRSRPGHLVFRKIQSVPILTTCSESQTETERRVYIKNVTKVFGANKTISFLTVVMAIPMFCGKLEAFSSGPSPRNTGAPGDNPGACSSCHLGTTLNGGPGGVNIILPNGSSYTPGVTQHIMVQVSD